MIGFPTTPDPRLGFALLAVAAGLAVAVHAAPGPDFSTWPPWSGVVKVAHGYLAYMGLNAGLAMGLVALREPTLAPTRFGR